MSLIKRIRWGRILLAGAAAGGLWHALSPECDLAEPAAVVIEADKLANRPWIDHLPRGERDMVSHVIFVDQGERLGAVGRSSRWRQAAELFLWKPGKGAVELTFPQTEKSATVPVTVKSCKAPAPLNLCLTLGSGKRAVTLYSSTEWQLTEPGAALSLLPISPDAEATEVDLLPFLQAE